MVVKGKRLLVVCIGRFCRRAPGLVWVLSKVPAAVEKELGPTFRSHSCPGQKQLHRLVEMHVGPPPFAFFPHASLLRHGDFPAPLRDAVVSDHVTDDA